MSALAGTELGWVTRMADFAGWPYEAAEAAYEVFGPRVFNGQGRTFKSLNRRIVHAVRVWEEKYGPFTEEQEAYAGKLLAWSIRQGAKGAGMDKSRLYAFVLSSLAKMVNHERVDAGFKRRQVEDAAIFDPLLDDLLKRVPR